MNGNTKLVPIYYVVYDRTTTDFPGMFVLRKFYKFPDGLVPEEACIVHEDVRELRKFIPENCEFHQDSYDDPVILEVWS